MVDGTEPRYELRRASSAEDLVAAQRLRYRVFVQELGGDGALVDHTLGLEKDRFDPFCDHLILFDHTRQVDVHDRAIGVYRVLRSEGAQAAGGYYSESEYDLTTLKASGRKLLELGRSCVDVQYRGGAAMYHLWNGLAQYVADYDIEVLFGVASFHGTDVQALAEPLSYLRHNHLAPRELLVRVREEHYQSMDLVAPDALDGLEAKRELPTLIKAYLRLGGFVGDGAFVDHEFKTTDVCLVMDTEQMSQRYRDYYARGKAL